LAYFALQALALRNVLERPYGHPFVPGNIDALSGNIGNESCSVFPDELPFDVCIPASSQLRANRFTERTKTLWRQKHHRRRRLSDHFINGTPDVRGKALVRPQDDSVRCVENRVGSVFKDGLLFFQQLLDFALLGFYFITDPFLFGDVVNGESQQLLAAAIECHEMHVGIPCLAVGALRPPFEIRNTLLENGANQPLPSSLAVGTVVLGGCGKGQGHLAQHVFAGSVAVHVRRSQVAVHDAGHWVNDDYGV